MKREFSARSVAILDARPGSGGALLGLLLWASAGGSGHVLAHLDPFGVSNALLTSFFLVQADRQPLEGSDQAVISSACLGCGSCALLCRFGAIQRTRMTGNALSHKTPWHVDPLNCVGCGVCARFCPSNAIFMSPPTVGSLQISRCPNSENTAVSLCLEAGRDLSANVAARAIREGKNRRIGKESVLFVTGIAATAVSTPTVCGEAETLIFTVSPMPGSERFLDRAARIASDAGRRAYAVIIDSGRDIDRTRELEAFSESVRIEPVGRLPYSGAWHAAEAAGTSIEHLSSSPDMASLIRNIIDILL